MALNPSTIALLSSPSDAEETTAGGIVLPDAAREKPQRGTVIAVGPRPSAGKWRTSGNVCRMALATKSCSASTAERTSKSMVSKSRSFAKATSSPSSLSSTAATEVSCALSRLWTQPNLVSTQSTLHPGVIVPKQLLFDDRARLKMQKGVNTLADVVAVTMGPTGRNVIIDKSSATLRSPKTA